MEQYRHKQIGWMMILLMLSPLVIAGLVTLFAPVPPDQFLFFAFPFIVIFLCLFLFMSLMVSIDNTAIRLSFGVGLIRKRIPLETISSYRRVRNNWMMGWGIRYIGTGWMWNIAGLDAVELTLTDGTIFRIGTDEPDRLCEAIRQAISTR